MFFKQQKSRDFKIPSRYWDEEEEKKKQRKRRIRAEMGLENDDDYVVPNLRGSFRGSTSGFRDQMEKQRKKSMIRLAIIVAALLLITYFLLGKEFINELFKP